MCCEEFGQDTRKEVWVCCMSCKKLAHFACTGLENVKMRFLQTVIFFFWDYRLRLPLPDAWLAMAIKYVLRFIFFYEYNFCFDKKNSQGCYSIFLVRVRTDAITILFCVS
jgi:hypothetical protein